MHLVQRRFCSKVWHAHFGFLPGRLITVHFTYCRDSSDPVFWTVVVGFLIGVPRIVALFAHPKILALPVRRDNTCKHVWHPIASLVGKGTSLPSVENCRRRRPLPPHLTLITIPEALITIGPESVIAFHRMESSSSAGIRDHVRPERAGGFWRGFGGDRGVEREIHFFAMPHSNACFL